MSAALVRRDTTQWTTTRNVKVYLSLLLLFPSFDTLSRPLENGLFTFVFFVSPVGVFVVGVLGYLFLLGSVVELASMRHGITCVKVPHLSLVFFFVYTSADPERGRETSTVGYALLLTTAVKKGKQTNNIYRRKLSSSWERSDPFLFADVHASQKERAS